MQDHAPLNFKRAVLTGFLGTGRIVSTIALVNQGMQATFSAFNLSKPLSDVFSIVAASSNGVSNAITRFKAIYDNLSDKKTVDMSELSTGGRATVYIIMGSGGLTLVFFVLNTFSAIIELECHYFGDHYCHPEIDWLSIGYYLPMAVIGSLSSGYAFSSYVLNIMKQHSVDFVNYFGDFSNNLKKSNKLILGGTVLLGLLNSMSLGATLYFSTFKMLFNLLGPTRSQSEVAQILLYSSVATAVVSNIFSAIADGKNLLEGKNSGDLRKWFCGESKARTILTTLLLPVLLADTASHGLNNYPGNIEILNKSTFFDERETIKKGFAIVNALNAAFLYFAFNTRRALNIVADVDASSIHPVETFLEDSSSIQEEIATEKNVLLSDSSRYSFFVHTDDDPKNITHEPINDTEQKLSKKCCSCIFL